MADTPRLKLRLMTHPTPKPTPIVFGVFDGDKEIGWVTLPEFYRAQYRLHQCGEPLPQYLKEEGRRPWQEEQIEANWDKAQERLEAVAEAITKAEVASQLDLQKGEVQWRTPQPFRAHQALIDGKLLTWKDNHWEDDQGNTIDVYWGD